MDYLTEHLYKKFGIESGGNQSDEDDSDSQDEEESN